MDPFTPALLDRGVKAMIGKGDRSPEVIAAMVRNQAVYFGAVGGIGALLSRAIVASEQLAFGDLGPEAIYRLTIRDFPALVLIDTQGRDYYHEGKARYRQDP